MQRAASFYAIEGTSPMLASVLCA